MKIEGQWVEEMHEPEKADSEKKTKEVVERSTEPTLRSSRNKQTVTELQEEIEETMVTSREQISTDFLPIAASVASQEFTQLQHK